MNGDTKKVQRGVIAFLKYAFLIFSAFVALVPIVSCVITAFIIFLLCQDQIYSGMAAGAVKG